MRAVTIADLQDRDNPAVVEGLKIKCGSCGTPPDIECPTPTGIIHYDRATEKHPAYKRRRR